MADTHATITGNLTDDPELVYTSSGQPVCNFRLAVTPRVRDGNGWKDGETSFFRISAWRDLAEHLADSLAKGDRAIVLGQLKTRAWETPEGDKRSVVEVTAEEAGPSLRWATAKPQRATQPNTKPAGRATTTHPAEPRTAGRPGRMAPDPGLAHHRK
jgi:single-strand DNA-binding protein